MRIRIAETFALITAIGSSSPASAQWAQQHPATNASFRGISLLCDGALWVSGTRGSFLWTGNGLDWAAGTVPGAATLDFRAVHAFSLDTAILMAAGQDTARIYLTVDRGAHWSLRYDDTRKGAFLDAIAFFDRAHGLALGDPIGGHFTLLETIDGGLTWRPSAAVLPAALAGEGAFAASGTALVTCSPREAWFATGGASVSRIFRTGDAGKTWTVVETPVRAGVAAAGIFSLACRDARHGIAVGGNYSSPDPAAITVAVTDDGGATWHASPPSPATAYLSGVAFVDDSTLVGVGTNGTALSRNGGRDWASLDMLPLNVVAARRESPRIWAAGPRGTVVSLTLPALGSRPQR